MYSWQGYLSQRTVPQQLAHGVRAATVARPHDTVHRKQAREEAVCDDVCKQRMVMPIPHIITHGHQKEIITVGPTNGMVISDPVLRMRHK